MYLFIYTYIYIFICSDLFNELCAARFKQHRVLPEMLRVYLHPRNHVSHIDSRKTLPAVAGIASSPRPNRSCSAVLEFQLSAADRSLCVGIWL